MTVFQNHFSTRAAEYAKYRPGYPEALFDWLATRVSAHDLAWDVGTGNGQAALGLARHFNLVVASDAAEMQLREAEHHPRITYKVMPAECTDLADASVDLIAVAQALHWFDFERFYAEARRVLKPEGVIAAWTYGLMRIAPDVDAVVRRYYVDIVGPYWPLERRHVDAAYSTVPFPFHEIEAPAFRMQRRWSLDDLLGYVGTWSATKRYLQACGEDPTTSIRGPLARAWGADAERTVEWPVHMRVGNATGR